jgi:hypothetical protein
MVAGLKLRAMFSTTAVLALALGIAACGSNGPGSSRNASPIANPTGTCAPPGDGSRAGYHSAAGTTWLPDCGNALRREYWRVFAQTPDSAYVIPRPDGARELASACNDPGHELNGLAQSYALCRPASSGAEVERVNDILPADALAITHFMHGVLRFTMDAGLGIAPHPLPSDIVDACALHPDTASADLRAICERERDRLESGHDIGFSYTGPGAVELVALLNELYGIR